MTSRAPLRGAPKHTVTATRQSSRSKRTTRVPREVLARVQQLRIRTHRLVDAGLSGGYRSSFRGQGIEFEEVRPYEPGDDVRTIDWRVTARTGEPYVKRYREERQLTIHLLVDTALELDFASRGRKKRDAAAALAALIGMVGARHQDRVGLTLFGPEPGEHLRPRSDGRHVMRLVRELYGAPVTAGRLVAAQRPGGHRACAAPAPCGALPHHGFLDRGRGRNRGR